MSPYERFAALCEEACEKPARVARETGISRAVFTNWKKGRRSPKADTLKLIADHFGVRMDYFLESDPYGINNRDISERKDIQPIYEPRGSRVRLVDAAHELGMGYVTLRQLMLRGKLDIGYVKEGRARCTFVIYRKKLDRLKAELGLMTTS